MKNLYFPILAAFLLSACNKAEKTATEQITTEQTYKATDGSRAKVIFKNKSGGIATMTITANGKTFQLERTQGTPESEIYNWNGITARVTTDSVIINQDNHVIELVKDK